MKKCNKNDECLAESGVRLGVGFGLIAMVYVAYYLAKEWLDKNFLIAFVIVVAETIFLIVGMAFFYTGLKIWVFHTVQRWRKKGDLRIISGISFSSGRSRFDPTIARWCGEV